MASPTKLTQTIRKNRDAKLARLRSKKTLREAPGAANAAVLAKLQAALGASKK